MAVRQMVMAGDSLSQVGSGIFTWGQGYQGIWAQIVTSRLARVPGIGPLVSSGLIACAPTQAQWTISAGWSDTASTDAWDKAPYGVTAAGATKVLKHGNGSTKTVTFTAGADILYPNVGFCLYYLDYTSAGNWSYSLDGGTSYTNMGQTIQNNNVIKKFYVPTPIVRGKTVIVRAADSAASGAGCCILGIEVFYQTPLTADGLIVHNIAVSGADLHELVLSTSGDRMAFFDSVVGATGTISNSPNVGLIIEHINDVTSIDNTTTWNTDLGLLNTRVSPLCPIGIWSPWEAINASYDTTDQAAYRTQTKTSAASFSPTWKTLDLYDDLVSNSITGNAATIAAGYLHDAVHPSQAGHIWMANKVYWWIKNNFFPSYNSPPIYTSLGSRTATVTTGGVSQYAALGSRENAEPGR